MKKLFAIAAIAAALSACGNPNETKPVAFDTVEQARKQARENAGYNAKNYRANSPQFVEYNVQNNGDSSQTNECPQGDGWASLKLVHPKNPGNVVDIKCSTVSEGIGCMTADEFKAKPNYSNMEGQCQPVNKVPFPLPKVGGQ